MVSVHIYIYILISIRDIIGSKKEKDQLPDFFRDNSDIITNYNGFNNFFSQIGPKLSSDIEQSELQFDSFLSDNNPVDFKFSRISETDILKVCRQVRLYLKKTSETNCSYYYNTTSLSY